MKEREGKQAQIPLFDEIPQELKSREGLIKQTFDGTLGTRGITMALNPSTGAVIRARLVDLETGKVTSYEPLARGKWTNYVVDLEEGSPAYEKLDRVYHDVSQKYELWKFSIRATTPLREWTTVKAKKLEEPFNAQIISPEEWYKKVINPEEGKGMYDEVEEEKERRPRRKRQSSAIIYSKDEPKLADARLATSGFRRNADRDTKRARKAIHNRQ